MPYLEVHGLESWGYNGQRLTKGFYETNDVDLLRAAARVRQGVSVHSRLPKNTSSQTEEKSPESKGMKPLTEYEMSERRANGGYSSDVQEAIDLASASRSKKTVKIEAYEDDVPSGPLTSDALKKSNVPKAFCDHDGCSFTSSNHGLKIHSIRAHGISLADPVKV